MSRIFISYRRDDTAPYAGRLYDHLSTHFGSNQIFMDIDTIAPGVDFVEVIEQAVSECDALVAVIGKHWVTMADAAGKRRLDDPHDFVRLEIATALKRNIRVIPVLVDDATMPRADELPEDLTKLVRRNALEVSNERFRYDTDKLIKALELVLTAPKISPPTQIIPSPVPESETEPVIPEQPDRLGTATFPSLPSRRLPTEAKSYLSILTARIPQRARLLTRQALGTLGGALPSALLMTVTWAVFLAALHLWFWQDPTIPDLAIEALRKPPSITTLPVSFGLLVIVSGVIAGLATGWVLHLSAPTIRWRQILAISASWALGQVVTFSYPSYPILASLPPSTWRDPIPSYFDYQLFRSIVVPLWVFPVLSLTVTLLGTGLALRWATISWRQIGITLLSWAIGLTFGFFLSPPVHESLVGPRLADWAVVGAVGGAIAGGVAYWTLKKHNVSVALSTG